MPRSNAVYYHVTVLRDGTIVAAFPDRKPRKSSMWNGKVDEDGIGQSYVETDYDRFSSWTEKPYGTIATHLNLKRLVREQIQPKLDALISSYSRCDAARKVLALTAM